MTIDVATGEIIESSEWIAVAESISSKIPDVVQDIDTKQALKSVKSDAKTFIAKIKTQEKSDLEALTEQYYQRNVDVFDARSMAFEAIKKIDAVVNDFDGRRKMQAKEKVEAEVAHQNSVHGLTGTKRSGLGKIQNPRTFYNGTNGHVREGFYDKILERSQKIFSGGNKNDRLFPFICKLDTIDEMDDPKMWSKANPMFEEDTSYSRRLFSTVKKEYDKLQEEPSGRKEFVVKRMNFTEGDSEKDVTTHEKLMATNQELPDLKGHSCVAGFDYASIRDFATVGLLFKEDDKYIWFQHSFARKQFLDTFKLKAPIKDWEKQGLVTILDEPSIDPRHLVNWLVEKRKDYNIEIVAADGFRMDLLRPLLDENEFTNEFFRNPRGVQAKVAPIIEDGFANERFIFGDDPMMRWYTNNTFVKEDSLGNRTFLKKEPVRRKTDGFHAFLSALYKRELIAETVDYDEAFDMLDELNF